MCVGNQNQHDLALLCFWVAFFVKIIKKIWIMKLLALLKGYCFWTEEKNPTPFWKSDLWSDDIFFWSSETSVGSNPVRSWVWSPVLVDKLGFEVRFFQIWAWVLTSTCFCGQTVSKFGLFGDVWMCSKFGFGGWSWVQVSLKFDLSGLMQLEVHYIWVRSNTRPDSKFNFAS